MAQLIKFTLSEMVRTSSALRQLGHDATSVEEFADRVVRCLRNILVDPITGEPETSLVRFYKTHPYGDLPEDLRAFASGLLEGGSSTSSMKCLTLLGTVGDEQAWGDRRASRGHRAVPLPSEEVVARLPMIAQLISQFGLAVGTVLEPDPELLVELDEKTYNVFYVPQAAGSPYIPAQDFVADHGIVSALGFGGMLPSGDLYAVVLFSRVAIPAETAELFRILALSVKVALLPLLDGPLLGSGPSCSADGGVDVPTDRRLLAVEQLLEVHERIAAQQAARVEEAWEGERRRAAQLRGLADAGMAFNSALSLAEILDHVTQRARLIVGAHQAVTSMTVGSEWAQAINAVSLSERYAPYADYAAAPPDGSGIYSMVCETNRAARMTQAELEAHPRWRRFGAESDRHPPMRGWLAAPLVARDGTNLGLVQLSDKYGDGEFTEEDQAILVQLAQMAAITIENARLFEREHQIAAELQRSLLPQELPSWPGVEVAARYHPAGAGVDVGGDWYDVFPVGEGSIAVVVGDVAGRGIAAASVMGQLRMALRAYAMVEASPSVVVARLDSLLQQLALVEFATVAYGVWSPRQGTLDLVLAGHPPPVLITPDGEISFAEVEPAVPLGALAHAPYPATRVAMEPGSTLLLYSDGLVEAPDLAIGAGLARLRRFVAAAPSDLDALCEHVALRALAAHADDDVTLLAVRAVGGGGAHLGDQRSATESRLRGGTEPERNEATRSLAPAV